MRYFTDDPLERLMMQVPHYGRQNKLDIPESHPCHGCPYGRDAPCIDICYRELLRRK